MTLFTAVAVVVIVLLGYVMSLYNRLVRLRNGVENALGSVDVQPSCAATSFRKSSTRCVPTWATRRTH